MFYLLLAAGTVLVLALLLIVSVIATVAIIGVFNLTKLIMLLRARRQIVLYRKSYP